MQEAVVVLAVLLAIGFLIRRRLKRTQNCGCGKAECPAAKGMADRLQEVARK